MDFEHKFYMGYSTSGTDSSYIINTLPLRLVMANPQELLPGPLRRIGAGLKSFKVSRNLQTDTRVCNPPKLAIEKMSDKQKFQQKRAARAYSIYIISLPDMQARIATQ